MDKLFQLYKQMLDLHIGTKTNDLVFHEASAGFYSLLFDVFHTISEKKQDIEEEEPIDCEEARASAYDIIERAKLIIEKMVNESQTIGMDNLLRGLVDKLETACGTARGLAMEENEIEEKGEKESKKGLKPIK